MKCKQIINGKMYNTETAKHLASYWNGRALGDFSRIDESLYRTAKGAFFLAGRGGPMTKYAVACGDNSTCGGERIIVVTEDEARSWLEKHGTAEEYITIFGEPEEA